MSKRKVLSMWVCSECGESKMLDIGAYMGAEWHDIYCDECEKLGYISRMEWCGYHDVKEEPNHD